MAASMGAVLLTAGAKGKRAALPNSRIMIHQPSSGAQGTASDIEIAAKEVLHIREKLNEILAKHTGQTVGRIAEDADRDRFMSPYEAVSTACWIASSKGPCRTARSRPIRPPSPGNKGKGLASPNEEPSCRATSTFDAASAASPRTA